MSDKSRILVPVTILNGTALSAEVPINDLQIIGIRMPAAWTAASMTFQALIDEPSALPKVPVFGEVVDNAGVAISLTVAAATYVALAETIALFALGRIKVRSGTSGVPVNQGGQRDFQLVCIPRA